MMRFSSFPDQGRHRLTSFSRIIVGPWTVDPATARIARDGDERVLEPKVMDLLALLASRPGRPFSREELFERLWPDVTVGDDSLARCVFKLRKALGDEAGDPRFVETIAKRGYRLIAPVAGESGPPRAAPRRLLQTRLWLAAASVALVAIASFSAFRLLAPAEPGFYPAPPGTAAAADEQRLRALAEADRQRQEANAPAGPASQASASEAR
jgi:DNA-binding winged helix-turn-helix (wHTH) protein